jgi:hypothetical protein
MWPCDLCIGEQCSDPLCAGGRQCQAALCTPQPYIEPWDDVEEGFDAGEWNNAPKPA